MTEKENEKLIPTYAPSYKILDNCLYETRSNKQGFYDRKLCNFLPWIVSEITKDDGIEVTTYVRLKGIHESGRSLPEIEIPAMELSTFNWLPKHWGMHCNLEVGKSVKDCVRHAIQSTVDGAAHQNVYSVTGWRKIHGAWEYLMPGDDTHTVSLSHKLGGYHMNRQCVDADLRVTSAMMDRYIAPPEIQHTLLAMVFLSPLNEFLRQAGCMPKFVLFLVGKTGSRKSTLAALFLSFFGRFTASELPLSFRDTANSIIHNAFTLKDVLTCIDDFYPGTTQEGRKLNEIAQNIMRTYGDRQGRGRLKADSTAMQSRPPQGCAIMTGEFPPEVAESGTSRYFAVEIKRNDVDLYELSAYQREALRGTLQNCMYGYIQWIKERFLCNEAAEKEFVAGLVRTHNKLRDGFLKDHPNVHGRVAEAVACLEIGMRMHLMFLLDRKIIFEEHSQRFYNSYQDMLYHLAEQQATSIVEDAPTHKFIRKLYALIESNQCCLLPRNRINDFTPGTCIGYEDDTFLYLNSDLAHRAVKKLCEDQGEAFTISCKALLKQLAEEDLIFTSAGQNTRSVRINGKSKRLLCLYREKAQLIADGVL